MPFYNHKIDFYLSDGKPFNAIIHDSYESVKLSAKVKFSQNVRNALQSISVPNERFIEKKAQEWQENGMPFNLIASRPNKMTLYLPFAGVKLPTNVQLSINGNDVPVQTYNLRNVTFWRYAFIENYVLFGQENQIELKIDGLEKNSFLGAFIGYPDVCDGMISKYKVIEDIVYSSRLYQDQSLIVDDIVLFPDVIDDVNCEYSVRVKTKVPKEIIDSVYCILPTQPEMPALIYEQNINAWCGKFNSGNRRTNI